MAGIVHPWSMGGRAEGLACADPEARTPIGASGNYIYFLRNLQNAKNIFLKMMLFLDHDKHKAFIFNIFWVITSSTVSEFK